MTQTTPDKTRVKFLLKLLFIQEYIKADMVTQEKISFNHKKVKLAPWCENKIKELTTPKKLNSKLVCLIESV